MGTACTALHLPAPLPVRQTPELRLRLGWPPEGLMSPGLAVEPSSLRMEFDKRVKVELRQEVCCTADGHGTVQHGTIQLDCL